jgi:hypothetical protein
MQKACQLLREIVGKIGSKLAKSPQNVNKISAKNERKMNKTAG